MKTGRSLSGKVDHMSAVRQVVGLVLGQLGIVTALAFYFGWARTSAFLRYFGLDTSVVSLTTTDYVLRSVGPAYWPLMWLGVLVVAALTLHAQLDRLFQHRPGLRKPVLGCAAAIGAGLLGVAVTGLSQVWIFPPSVPVIPLSIASGVALLTYSATFYSPQEPRSNTLVGKAQFVALSALIAGGIFWAWGSYAGTQGEEAAREMDDSLAHRADVSVFSARRLGLNGPGIVVDPVGDEDSVYRFRYTGLRLLMRSDTRYFLLPKEWQRGHDSVIVLSDSEETRLQFIAPP
jgi:hypothetical protein